MEYTQFTATGGYWLEWPVSRRKIFQHMFILFEAVISQIVQHMLKTLGRKFFANTGYISHQISP